MLQVSNVSKIFYSGYFRISQHQALNDISFSLDKGETLGIIGESGCGKSTLARILAGLLPCTSGRIELDGQDVTNQRGADLKAYHKKVQIMFQDPVTALDPSMKLRACILEGARNYQLTSGNRKDEEAYLNGLLEMVGMQKEHLNRYTWELSGGQIQRAVLARVLALEPEILLADEPTSMLDVSVQAQILGLIRRMQEKTGFSILFISHDLDVVKVFCDRVLVMKDGSIIEQGSISDVLDNPSAEYTRKLIQLADTGDSRAARSVVSVQPDPL